MIRVAIAVIQKDGKFLIARRKKRGPFQGMWEFPGGRVEEGETPEECVCREAAEELGIDISVEGLICSNTHSYPHETVELIAYRASLLSGEMNTREYDEITWASPHELPRHAFPVANAPLIEKLLQQC